MVALRPYEEVYNEHLDYLKRIVKSPKGTQQGYLTTDILGDVTARIGRISNNPQWYRDIYKKLGRRPTHKELEALAHVHLREGFVDEFGYIPPLFTAYLDSPTDTE